MYKLTRRRVAGLPDCFNKSNYPCKIIGYLLTNNPTSLDLDRKTNQFIVILFLHQNGSPIIIKINSKT